MNSSKMTEMLQNFFKSLFGRPKPRTIQTVRTSPNFNARKGIYAGQNPSIIVLHYTGMKSAEAAIDRLCDKAAEVSAHYVIEENSQIHQLVDDDKRAWHAGVSHWAGQDDINSASIGIEIVNSGHELGYHEFPEAQIDAVIELCDRLMKAYGIQSSHVLGHSDIAPGRKIDPGEKFPWQILAEAGIGLWPAPQEMDYQSAQDIILSADQIKTQFVNFGYDPDCDLEVLVTEFHRHFYPEKFAGGENPRQADVASVAKLLSLLRQREEIV